MTIRKVFLIILISALLIPVLSGCSGSREIDDWAYVYTLGVDKGITNNLRMTVQIATLKGGSGTGGSSQGGQGGVEGNDYVVYSLDCPTFYSGVNMLNTALSRRINYSQAKYFVCSEEFAKTDIGLLMSAFVRDRQIRRTMHMIIVRGKASEFISAINPTVGTAISKTQEGMMGMMGITGFFYDTKLGHFLDDLKSSKTQSVAVLAGINDFSTFVENGPPSIPFRQPGNYYAGELPRKGGNKTEFLGTALFDGGKLIGELDGDESRCLLMVQGVYKEGAYAIQGPLGPDELITVNVKQQKRPDIDITFDKQKALIYAHIYLEGDLLAARTDVDYESPGLKPLLEGKVKDLIKGQLDETIKKSQDLNCDCFGFGETAAMQFPTIPEWESYHWLERFKDAQITTEVDFIIRRTGTMIKTNPVKISGGKGQ